MTQDLKQKKVAQIRALLSKTTEAGCTPAEADAAQAMAADLMAKYAVEMADLSDIDHDEIEEMLKYALNPQNTYPWNKTLACAVQTMTNTFLLQSKNGRYPVFTFYGAKSDVENATWMFKAYLDALAPMWKAYMRENGYTSDTAEKNAWYEFRKGVAMGVLRKAHDSRKTAMQLASSKAIAVIDDKLQRATAFASGITTWRSTKARATYVRNSGAYYAGVQAGSSYGVGSKPSARPQLGSGR